MSKLNLPHLPIGPKVWSQTSPTHSLSNNPQIDLFLIKGKDIKYMLETSVSDLCGDGSCYGSGFLQLSGLRVTYRVTDTNSGNRIKECCTNTFWPLQNLRKIAVFRIFNSLAKNQHTQETIVFFEYNEWQFVRKCQNLTLKMNFLCQE